MAIQFGNTWWGKQWLQSLGRIDFKNRMDRGKAYVRNNSVGYLSGDDNMIPVF